VKLERPPDHLSSESAMMWRRLVADFEFTTEAYRLLRIALEAKDWSDYALQALREGATAEVVTVYLASNEYFGQMMGKLSGLRLRRRPPLVEYDDHETAHREIIHGGQ
jgi:hypothetical protein